MDIRIEVLISGFGICIAFLTWIANSIKEIKTDTRYARDKVNEHEIKIINLEKGTETLFGFHNGVQKAHK